MPFDTRPVRRVEARDDGPSDAWPATVPAVAQVLRDGLDLAAGVTFLVGENGSGKSTLIEGVAGAYGLGLEGGERQSLHRTYASESGLHERLRLVRGVSSTRNGFFLRAETMHGFFTYLATEAGASGYHEMSHGESFLEAMEWYFRHPGFFCLDEPEAALSFSSTLVLVSRLHELGRTEGAQVLCATHSPVLAALPGATILEVGEWGLRETTWDDLVLVANWRSYLQDPHRYLRHVLEP
ncbi:AAA family ATPase [Microlunatus spumicola]|uniref:AAA family ATPase n=1 Tax=Microlunatus spumicola TaxID=81499 RepID=A0ABP6Y2J0_9ACTN